MATRSEARSPGARGGLRTLGAAAALALALSASACSLAFKRPTVRVAEVRLSSLDLRGGTLAVRLRITNPNRYALESRDFRYALSFLNADGGAPADGDEKWVRLAEGRMSESVKVPAHETGTVTVEVPFDLGTVGLAAGRLLRQRELEYRFTGELTFHTPLGGKRLPFDERGTYRP